MTQEERIHINQAAKFGPIPVYCGKTLDKVHYVVDDRDCLPPDITEFYVGSLDCTGTALVAAVESTESVGWSVCLQVGDVYYETASP